MTLSAILRTLRRSWFGRHRRREAEGLRRAAGLYQRGKAAYQSGQLGAASGLFAEVVSLVPANASAWYYIGRIRYKSADYAEAIRAFEQAIALEPDNPNIARWLENAGALAARPPRRQTRSKPVRVSPVEPQIPVSRVAARARRVVEVLTRGAQGSAGGAVSVGQSAAPPGDSLPLSRAAARARRVAESLSGGARPGLLAELSLDQLRATVEARGGEAGPRLAFARRLMEAGAHDEAYGHWRILLDRGSNAGEAAAAIGRICLARGESEEALAQLAKVVHGSKTSIDVKRDYARALSLVVAGEPRRGEALLAEAQALARHRRLAYAFEAAGDLAEAETILEIVQAASGSNDDSRKLLEFYGRRNRFGRARQFLEDYRKFRTDHPDHYLLEADFMAAHGKTDAAIDRLTRGHEAFPQDARIIPRLARLLSRQRAWPAAAEIWRRAVALEIPGARIELAETFRHAGHYEEAVQEFRAIEAQNIGNARVSIGLSRSLRRIGQDHEGIAVLYNHINSAPGDLKVWEELVYCLARSEREAEAVEALERASAALGSGPMAACSLARMAERALLNDEAEVIFRRAAEAHPDSEVILGEFGRYYLRQGMLSEAARTLDAAAAVSTATDAFQAEFAQIGGIGDLLEGYLEDRAIKVPEDLIAHVARRRAVYRGRPYVPGRVAFLATKLKAGGGERQAALTAATLARLGPPVESVSFHCLSLSAQQKHDFYLPILANLPIEVTSAGHETLDELLETKISPDHADLIRFLPDDLAMAVAVWLIEIEKRRPEVVHAWQDFGAIAGALAAILAGVPRIILSARSTRPDNKYRRLKRYMGDGYRALLDAEGVILCNNSTAGAVDYEAWLGLTPGSVDVVYNGLDFSQLDRDNSVEAREAVRRKLNISGDTPLIGGVFRFVGVKRPLLWVETAAKVAARIPEVHFMICGNGELEKETRARAEALGLGGRLHLVGIRDPIAPWYGAMDLSLLASQREGLPNVLLESQYLGVPVVSSDVGGVGEVIDQGVTGWAVADADADRLAERLIWCLDHPEWLKTASVAARAFARDRFSLERVTRRTLELYGIETPRPDQGAGERSAQAAFAPAKTVMEWT